MNARRNFLKNLFGAPAAIAGAASAANAKTPNLEPKVVTVEKTVVEYRDLPANVTPEEAAIWLEITAQRRGERQARNAAEMDRLSGRLFSESDLTK
jgi:hypothetical protein